MDNRKNCYESLRQPGVRGKVVNRDYRTLVVYNTMLSYLSVITGELLPGVWDYGYIFHREDRGGVVTDDLRRFPGEGDGWFRSENDARLYALDELLRLFRDMRLDTYGIILRIKELSNPALF